MISQFLFSSFFSPSPLRVEFIMHSGCLFIGLLLLIGRSVLYFVFSFEGELTAVATGFGSAYFVASD